MKFDINILLVLGEFYGERDQVRSPTVNENDFCNFLLFILTSKLLKIKKRATTIGIWTTPDWDIGFVSSVFLFQRFFFNPKISGFESPNFTFPLHFLFCNSLPRRNGRSGEDDGEWKKKIKNVTKNQRESFTGEACYRTRLKYEVFSLSILNLLNIFVLSK